MPRQSLEALLLAIFSWAWTATAEFDGLTFGGLLSHPVRSVKLITPKGKQYTSTESESMREQVVASADRFLG